MKPLPLVPIGVRRLVPLLVLVGVATQAFAQGARWDSEEDRGRSRVEERLQRRRDRAERRWNGDRPGVHLRIGGDYYVPADTTVSEPIVVIGGTATVDGHAANVVVIGGTMKIGPTAVVRGDMTVVGGEMTIDPMADVSGKVHNIALAWPRLGVFPAVGAWRWWPFDAPWRIISATATVLRLGIVLIAGIILTLVFPATIRDVSARAASVPGLAALLGFAAEVLFFPALIALVVVLVITIVGIPLLAGLPVALAVFAMAWTAGFTAVAARVGAALTGSSLDSRTPGAGEFFLGFLLLTGLSLAGNLLALGPVWLAPFAAVLSGAGLLVEYVAWTVGLGAAIVALFGDRRVSVPPLPVPSPLRP